MFALSYQKGNSGIEVLSSNGKDPLKPSLKLAVVRGKVDRSYDRASKGYCFELLTPGSSSLQCPATSRQTLGLTQRFLVLQIKVEKDTPSFSFEVAFLDDEGRRKRIHYSSNFRSFEPLNDLSAQVPLNLALFTGKWTNFIIDMEDLSERAFPGARFGSVDGLVVKPCCQLRKIFTLPKFDEDNPVIPAAFEFIRGTDKAPNALFRTAEHCRDRVDARVTPVKKQASVTQRQRKGAAKGGVESEGTASTAVTSTASTPVNDGANLSVGSVYGDQSPGTERAMGYARGKHASPSLNKAKTFDASPFKNTARRYNDRERAMLNLPVAGADQARVRGMRSPEVADVRDNETDTSMASGDEHCSSELMKLPSPAVVRSVDLAAGSSSSRAASPALSVGKVPTGSRFSDVRVSPSAPLPLGSKPFAGCMDDDDNGVKDGAADNHDDTACEDSSHPTVPMPPSSVHSSRSSCGAGEGVGGPTDDHAGSNPWTGLGGPSRSDRASKWSFLTGGGVYQPSGSLEDETMGALAGSAPSSAQPSARSYGNPNTSQFGDDANDEITGHEFYEDEDDEDVEEESGALVRSSEEEREQEGDADDADGDVLLYPAENSLDAGVNGTAFYDDDSDMYAEKSASKEISADVDDSGVSPGPPSVGSEWSAESYGQGPVRFSMQAWGNPGNMVASLEQLDVAEEQEQEQEQVHEVSTKPCVPLASTVSVSDSSDDEDEDGNVGFSFVQSGKMSDEGDEEEDGWAQIEALEQEFATHGNVIQGVLAGDEAPSSFTDAAALDALATKALVDAIPMYGGRAPLRSGLYRSLEASGTHANGSTCAGEVTRGGQRPQTAPKQPGGHCSSTTGAEAEVEVESLLRARADFDSSGRFPLSEMRQKGSPSSSKGACPPPSRLHASRMSTTTVSKCLDEIQENLRKEEELFLQEYGVDDFLNILGGESFQSAPV